MLSCCLCGLRLKDYFQFVCVFYFVSCKTSQNVNILQHTTSVKSIQSFKTTTILDAKGSKLYALFFLVSLAETTCRIEFHLERALLGLERVKYSIFMCYMSEYEYECYVSEAILNNSCFLEAKLGFVELLCWPTTEVFIVFLIVCHIVVFLVATIRISCISLPCFRNTLVSALLVMLVCISIYASKETCWINHLEFTNLTAVKISEADGKRIWKVSNIRYVICNK